MVFFIGLSASDLRTFIRFSHFWNSFKPNFNFAMMKSYSLYQRWKEWCKTSFPTIPFWAKVEMIYMFWVCMLIKFFIFFFNFFGYDENLRFWFHFLNHFTMLQINRVGCGSEPFIETMFFVCYLQCVYGNWLENSIVFFYQIIVSKLIAVMIQNKFNLYIQNFFVMHKIYFGAIKFA